MSRMQNKKISGPMLSLAVLMLISSAFLALYTYQEHKTFVEHQQQIGHRSATGAADSITVFLEGLGTSLDIFAEGRRKLLSQLVRNPENSEVYAQIDEILASHYSDYYAFTLADSTGQVLYDDFGERIGDICRQDIQRFSQSSQPVGIYIHPGPGEYHIDLIQSAFVNGESYVFFTSFKINVIARLLHNAQVYGHELLLVRTDKPGLIEVTADGSRSGYTGTFLLSEQQRERIVSTTSVAGTRWILLDLVDESLFWRKNIALAGKVGGVLTVFFLAGGLMMRRLSNEERARRAAEQALKHSHEQLEVRVCARTFDLTEANRNLQHESDQRRKLFRVVEQIDDIVVITNLEGLTEYVNPAFVKQTGISAREALGHKQNIVGSGKHSDAFYHRMWRTLKSGRVFRDTFINQRKDGSLYHEEKTITPLRDENGNVTHYVSTGKDITEHIIAKKQIEKLAYHDTLTGLPNRLLLMDRLEHALTHAKRAQRLLAVLFLDLDRFKTINDSLGHDVGDQLLKVIAERLCQCARNSDSVARLSGDEFSLIMESVCNVSDVEIVAQRVIDTVSRSAIIDGHELFITVSVGVSIFPFEDGGAASLLKSADTAMYYAKSQSGNSFAFYTADMGAVADRRLVMESRLRGAMERNEFQIYYQPRITLADGQVNGVEALLRWQSPALGTVSPVEFIPLLEETGHIEEVGEWVLRQACIEFGSLESSLRLAVNLSPRQFVQPELAHRITDILAETNFDPGYLDIEITESVLAQDPALTVEILETLHEAGIHIAIDDFGTGYSSLSYLRRFPIDCLKVDRAFVRNLAEDSADVKLVTAIIAMAHSLQMTVVTEGIETKEQLAVVRHLGSEEGQGYLFSPPLPLVELKAWLDTDFMHENSTWASSA